MKEGGVLAINCPWSTVEELDKNLPAYLKNEIALRKAKLYTIYAEKIAAEVGLKSKINSIMTACFYDLSGVLPEAEAINLLKRDITKMYNRKGDEVVDMNINAVDQTLHNLHKIEYP